MKHRLKQIIAAAIICLPTTVLVGSKPLTAAVDNCNEATLHCPAQAAETLSGTLYKLSTPNVAAAAPTPPPADVPRPATAGNAKTRTVTYSVTTRGNITASLTEFKAQVAQTFADSRGWGRLGITFSPVESGGQFIVVLTEASQVPSFSSGCDAMYSCAVGKYVIINQDRWLGATEAWNIGGGSLRDYRHMVINHETGHWLGHGHPHCGGPGLPAPVMQQQSMNLEGCAFNPWPLSSELYSSTLGI